MHSFGHGTTIQLLSQPSTCSRFSVFVPFHYHCLQLLVRYHRGPMELTLSYSTCLGRVARWKNQNKIGFIDLDLPGRLLELLKEDINGTSCNSSSEAG